MFYKKTKQAKFSEKQHFLPPDTHRYVCVSRSKKCSFFGKFGLLCFLVTPVLRFALLPYCRRIAKRENRNTEKPQSFTLCRNRREKKRFSAWAVLRNFIRFIGKHRWGKSVCNLNSHLRDRRQISLLMLSKFKRINFYSPKIIRKP